MRAPLEYGDNFPVTGIWDPTVPWRFPQHIVRPKSVFGSFTQILPWLMLGVGVMVGVLWLSWRTEHLTGNSSFLDKDAVPGMLNKASVPLQGPPLAPVQASPRTRPVRGRSRLA